MRSDVSNDQWKVEVFNGLRGKVTIENIPIPIPPMTRPAKRYAGVCAPVCKPVPRVKMMTAVIIEYFLEILSARYPLNRAPAQAPSSRAETSHYTSQS